VGIHAVNRAVFLDRDGTLTRAVVREGRPYPPSSVDGLEVLPGVAEGLARLRAAGFLLIVVTNQPDVARGSLSVVQVEAMNRALVERLPLDDVRVCTHDDADHCACRKPAPGMLVDAATDHGIDLGASVMIGDRWRDVEAGRRAGCATVFIDCQYQEELRSAPDAVVKSFAEAADWVMARVNAG
jgi:D-glycero-D-manno-heptose 1,7-bisphosphate phosphatase